MGTFKHPSRSVWHTSVCSRCRRVIQRVLLPGLQKTTSYRVCDRCLSEGSNAQSQAAGAAAAGAQGTAGRGRGRGGRGGRRSAAQQPAAATASE